jgi:translation initiation factor 2B subunit (eIF-2B alpha/beta/delta family)
MALTLDSDLSQKLEGIQSHVIALWKYHEGPPWYPYHDESHNRIVEKMLHQLIPEDREDQLSSEEWFFLLASTWLHDVGMILDLFGRSEPFEEVRTTHHERSARYIGEEREELDLNIQEAFILEQICKYHRKRLDIGKCPERAGSIRVRMLAAYLRLADALHIDISRTDEARYKLLLAAGMPWQDRFHWLKSRWVHSAVPNPDNHSILVSVFDAPEGSLKRGLLPRLVENEIREELDSVRDVLIRGGVSFFLDIDMETIGSPTTPEERTELELVLSNIEIENLSSATDVENSIITTVIRLAEVSPDPYIAIQDYRQQMSEVHRVRPSHALLGNVLERITRATLEEDLPADAQKARVEQIIAELRAYQESRSRSVSALAENARPFLSDGGGILLFGYSSLVLEALRRLPLDVKEVTPIFIAECRGKTRYSYRNEIVYSDALHYSIGLRDAGFKNVAIAPDISAANLMMRGLIDKVVLGANGIDAHGRFGHTAGHLALADLARVYRVPVYVIADTAKFGQLEFNIDAERGIEWFTRDRRVLALIEQYDIATPNPREDIVEADRVDMLITEIGAFPPTKIPKAVRRKVFLD